MKARSLKNSPRNEYQQQESARVQASPLLVETFPALKSLCVDLAYSDVDRPGRGSQIKYTVNLDTARTVFRISCQNPECVGGDFDLSDTLSKSIRARRASVSSELSCQGWRNAANINLQRCGRVLRSELALGY